MNNRLVIITFLLLIFRVSSAQKVQSQSGFILTYGAGFATESVKDFRLDIENDFAWQAAIGYHANVAGWFALRFQINYERTAVEESTYGPANVVGQRDLELQERSFTSTRFLVNPVFYLRIDRWQYNFSPGIGIAYCKNFYTESYYIEDADGERNPVFSNNYLKVKKPFLGFTPFISVAYQLTTKRGFKSWVELGFQPSFWYQLGEKKYTYTSNYHSYMFQLSYMFNFK